MRNQQQVVSNSSSNGDGCTRWLLRVKNLPSVLSLDATTALLSHYGAVEVRLLKDSSAAAAGRTKRAPQTAIATFRDDATRASALRRLHELELAGHVLHVKAVGGATTESHDAAPHDAVPSKQKAFDDLPNAQPPLPPGPPPPLPPPTPPAAPSVASDHSSYCTPAPLAPHLGLHFAPSPLLEYKYPRASESVVRNIANALLALPKFYTQVLHLMNKMNLPLPFDDDAIPGVFSTSRSNDDNGTQRTTAAAATKRKRRLPGDQRPSVFTIEEDDDDDDGDVVEPVAESIGDSGDRKRLRTDGTDGQAPATRVAAPLPAPAAPRSSKSKASSTSAVASAFSDNSSLDPHRNSTGRPGVMSQHELARRKVPLDELRQCDAMRDYTPGTPSRTLLVQNLAPSVDAQDVAFVARCVVPCDMDVTDVQIAMRDAPTRAATVTYPTQALAAKALTVLHGVTLEAHPLVVSFTTDKDGATSDAEDRDAITSATRTLTLSLQELDARRLDASALATEPFMTRYERGAASPTLYVKNLAKDVTTSELLAVFYAAMPLGTSQTAISMRHFTAGRMKCQAFVTFPSSDVATAALEATHGVVVQGKPLIVCFRKAPARTVQSAEPDDVNNAAVGDKPLD